MMTADHAKMPAKMAKASVAIKGMGWKWRRARLAKKARPPTSKDRRRRKMAVAGCMAGSVAEKGGRRLPRLPAYGGRSPPSLLIPKTRIADGKAKREEKAKTTSQGLTLGQHGRAFQAGMLDTERGWLGQIKA